MNLSAHYKQVAQGVLSAESGARFFRRHPDPTAPTCSDSQARMRSIVRFCYPILFRVKLFARGFGLGNELIFFRLFNFAAFHSPPWGPVGKKRRWGLILLIFCCRTQPSKKACLAELLLRGATVLYNDGNICTARVAPFLQAFF